MFRRGKQQRAGEGPTHPVSTGGGGPWEGTGKQDVRFEWENKANPRNSHHHRGKTVAGKHSLLSALSLNPGSHEDFLSAFPCDSDPALDPLWVPPQNTLEPCPARCGPSYPPAAGKMESPTCSCSRRFNTTVPVLRAHPGHGLPPLLGFAET